MLRFVIAIVLTANTALAGGHFDAAPLPALFNVVDVASDDVLNVRQQPTAKSPIISELAYDQTYVEVIEVTENGRWGRVGTGESGMGWVYMRYMAAVPNGSFPDWPAMRCNGSEAPWMFTFEQGGEAIYRQSYEEGMRLQASALRKGSESFLAWGMAARGPNVTVTASIRQLQCDSTMIDDTSGFQGVIVAAFADGTTYTHSGCCSLVAP
ncbi:SH3 domain-containing protein [Thalassococcus lentus]|uniref:SH3 domain-containing protein n=1 Tax=Thalassococcus lentus TaxID=1210524 RepID=A0ABT4XPI0_9RHOB|nr:SH3 domain-containing protein [Thalassococcus lentus]MDA7423858.1 SH3 domain-containing protein [Thalassococcus lentus]